MTANPSWSDTGAELLTDVRYDPWGCDAFDMLDKYIASRKAHIGGINALGVTWDSGKYDLPSGEYRKQYELEKDIDLGLIRADAERILQAGKDQEALEELRTKAMESLKSHWNDSVTEAAHANFDENKKIAITNVDAAKANARGILQVADSIQQLLKDKREKTQSALEILFEAIKQNDADFERKCESAAKNAQEGYGAESAEWMVASQPNDKKSKILTDLMTSQDDVRNRIYKQTQSDADAGYDKDSVRKIFWDGGPPTTYRLDISWNPDRYLTEEELARLKKTAEDRLDSPGGLSRKYYVEAGGASEYQIWERKDVIADQNHVMGHINDTCQQLLQLNYDTKNEISKQYNTMAGYLDNINTAPSQNPGVGAERPAGSTGGGNTAGGSLGASGVAGTGGAAAPSSGLPSSGTPSAADLSSDAGAGGAGSGGDGGSALGSAGQSLGQAVSGLGSALGGALQSLMGSLGQIIQSAQQAARQAQQQYPQVDQGEDDGNELDGGQKDASADEAPGEDENPAESDQRGTATVTAPSAPPGPDNRAPAAGPGASAATAPAGMGHAPAAGNDAGTHKQADNNRGDFEVQASIRHIGANNGNQGHITGFE